MNISILVRRVPEHLRAQLCVPQPCDLPRSELRGVPRVGVEGPAGRSQQLRGPGPTGAGHQSLEHQGGG